MRLVVHTRMSGWLIEGATPVHVPGRFCYDRRPKLLLGTLDWHNYRSAERLLTTIHLSLHLRSACTHEIRSCTKQTGTTNENYAVPALIDLQLGELHKQTIIRSPRKNCFHSPLPFIRIVHRDCP